MQTHITPLNGICRCQVSATGLCCLECVCVNVWCFSWSSETRRLLPGPSWILHCSTYPHSSSNLPLIHSHAHFHMQLSKRKCIMLNALKCINFGHTHTWVNTYFLIIAENSHFSLNAKHFWAHFKSLVWVLNQEAATLLQVQISVYTLTKTF